MIGWLLDWVYFFFFLVGTFSVLTYAVPFFLAAFVWNKEQDLKKKYDAKWALVTGASSGIGRALVEKLAKQGLNVVLVALDDPLLPELHDKLKKQYSNQEFRSVPVDLGKDGYMEPIIKATEDITVSLLFNNAGFVMAGFFSDIPIERSLKNFEVNATCALKITHHFLNKMLSAKIKGAIVFTSSPSGLIPTPLTMMYCSTKAFLTNFACSLAGEVKKDGIDVLVVHPSPVDSNFYKFEGSDKHGLLSFVGKHASPPTLIANTIFSSIGVGFGPVRDQGAAAFGLKFLIKFIDYNLFAWIMMVSAPFQSEYGKFLEERKKQKKN